MEKAAYQIPPRATLVIHRAFVLAALVCRGFIDGAVEKPEAEAIQNQVIAWLTKRKLWKKIEPEEARILRADIGTLTQEEVTQITWYAEGLAILAWALNRMELPRHDEEVDPYLTTDAVWFLDEDAEEVLAAASLRSQPELAACREVLYAIHCRLRAVMRERQRQDFSAWIEMSWLDILKLDKSQLLIEGDLAVRGEGVAEVSEPHLQHCEAIMRERHRAIIWLFDSDTTYSLISVDT